MAGTYALIFVSFGAWGCDGFGLSKMCVEFHCERIGDLFLARRLKSSGSDLHYNHDSSDSDRIAQLRAVFIKHCHARLVKYFSCHMPFGRKQAYAPDQGLWFPNSDQSLPVLGASGKKRNLGGSSAKLYFTEYD